MNKDTLALIGIVALALLVGGGTGAIYVATRGLRNNNPGNIRAGSAWVGLVGTDDAGFAVFDSPENGIRALGKTLLTYANRYGLDTVRDIITRWAPPTENDTASYIADVAARLGVASGEVLNVPARLPDLARAIIRHENGLNPYSDATIAEGIRRALA